MINPLDLELFDFVIDTNYEEQLKDELFEYPVALPKSLHLFHTPQIYKHSITNGIDYFIGKCLRSQAIRRSTSSDRVREYQHIASVFYAKNAIAFTRRICTNI